MSDQHIPEYSSIQNVPDHRSDQEKLSSPLSIFDQNNPEIANMERQALDYIHTSGAWTQVYLRSNALLEVDEVWEEDANPVYDLPKPFKGQFAPEPMSAALNKWGYEANTKFKINYSRAELLDALGNRLIRAGDVIAIPHNTLIQQQNTEFVDGPIGLADKFRVVGAQDIGNYNYRWLYWTCTVELLTGDITVRPEHDL
jgi:hypothetical protein